MPLNKKLSKIENRITIEGYEMVLNPKTHQWVFTHMLADQYNTKYNIYNENKGSHKHHIDFNKLNNSPDNIKRMDPCEHLDLHRQHIKLTLHKKEVVEKCNKIKKSLEYREKISKIIKKQFGQMLSVKAKKQWADPKYKNYMVKKYMEFYHGNQEYREKNSQLLNSAQKKYWAICGHRIKQSNRVTEYFLAHPQLIAQVEGAKITR